MAKTKAQDRIRLPDGREMTAAAALDAGLLKLVESRYYDPPRYFLRSVGDEVSWEIGKTFYQSRTGGKLPFKGTERITMKRSLPRRESPAAAVEACADKGARAAIYQCAIGRAGLYHKTFFAHKATPAERRWINDAWHEATKVDMKKRGLGRARRARARRKGRR